MSDNVELVKRGYEAYAKGDFATVMALLDPEIELVQTELLPWGGHHRGLAGAQTFFGLIAQHVDAIPEWRLMVPAGNDVAMVGRLKGRARASGKPIDLDIVHVWTLRDGRAVRFAAWIDTPAMLTALGEESPRVDPVRADGPPA
jgi:ketosteroid isomerase-like protein